MWICCIYPHRLDDDGNGGTKLIRAHYYAVLLLTGVMVGCNVQLPRFFRSPGYVYQQQLGAVEYDPYADRQAATGFLGDRPPSFTTQRSQAERSQWFASGQRGQ